MMSRSKCIVWCLSLLVSAPGLLQAAIWQDAVSPALMEKGNAAVPRYYRALQADQDQLRQALALAPQEDTSSQWATISLPLPQGVNQMFELEASPILAPALAAAYPEITTYRVRGIDDPSITGRLDMTPEGFHAMLTTPAGAVFIDPDGDGGYRSYFKQDFATSLGGEVSAPVCRMGELSPETTTGTETTVLPSLAQRSVSGDQRRIYRLAVSTTGEYGQYFGGSKSVVTANIVTTINRVNQIYGRDLAIQLQLAAVVIYTNPSTDPYDPNGSLTALLAKNQEILDFEVGTDNYDIGHVFGLAGGGLASLGAACSTNTKAQGYTGHPTPVGDVFYIDFVAHELGHQLNATHSFNGTTLNCASPNRYANTAVEPGSGSTIMAYAGICAGENLQSTSDATFHAANIQQVNSFAFSGSGSRCGTLTATGNTSPTSNAGANATIPQGTPFVLTGSASDMDGDSLSYQWDEIDANGEPTTNLTIGTDLTTNPLFRSFVPKSTPTRFFPKLSTLIDGVPNIGETLPTTFRILKFRMTVRDGNSGVADDDLILAVDNTVGPFRITASELNNPTGMANFQGGQAQSLSWDSAGTELDCPTVAISLLSISDDGSSYCDRNDDPRLFIGNHSNNGMPSISVTLPALQIERARVMVACADNIFFDLSDNDFTVTEPGNPAPTPVPSNCKAVDGEALEHGTVFTSSNITQSSSGGGGGGSLFWLSLLLGLGGLAKRHIGRE